MVDQISEEAATAGRDATGFQHAINVWCGFGATREAARAPLAAGMQTMYQMPFEPFERYSPYGTPQQVAEFLRPYVEAGCSTFNVIPCATDHDSAVAAVGELRRLLSDEAETVDSLVVTPEDPMRSQSPVGWMAAATTLRTPLGRRVKVIEHGTGTPVVFLHSGVGSAGEWRQVFSLWPEGYRLVAIEAYRDGTGPGVAGRRSLDDYADQVYAVAEHVGVPVRLVGFSWGGATALRVAAVAPEIVDSLAVIEPEAYALLRTQDAVAYTEICGLRDRWRAHVRAGRWYEALEEFVDFYNGPGSFARWPSRRREAFLAVQQARGDLWDVLFDGPLTVDALARVTAPVHVVEGSQTSAVDHAICEIVRRHVPHAQHTLIEGAGHMMPLTHAAELTQTLVVAVAKASRSSAVQP